MDTKTPFRQVVDGGETLRRVRQDLSNAVTRTQHKGQSSGRQCRGIRQGPEWSRVVLEKARLLGSWATSVHALDKGGVDRDRGRAEAHEPQVR